METTLTSNTQTSTTLKNGVKVCFSTFSKAIGTATHSLVSFPGCPHVQTKNQKGSDGKLERGRLGTRRSYTHQFSQIRAWEAVGRLICT